VTKNNVYQSIYVRFLSNKYNCSKKEKQLHKKHEKLKITFCLLRLKRQICSKSKDNQEDLVDMATRIGNLFLASEFSIFFPVFAEAERWVEQSAPPFPGANNLE